MSGTADPWEPVCSPALLHTTQRTPTVEQTGGPERVYDTEAAKEPMPPRGPLGFAPPPPHPQRLASTADVDAMLTQVRADRDALYWTDRLDQLDGVESWLLSLRDHRSGT